MSSTPKKVQPLGTAAKLKKALKAKKLAIDYGAGNVALAALSQKMVETTDAEMMALYKKTHLEDLITIDSVPMDYAKLEKKVLAQIATKENGMDAKIFDLGKLKTAVTLPLMGATHLYQPVNGTSSGSRYFVLAIGKNLRIAGRWQASSLALRVEGPGLEEEETKALIVGCGLDFKSAKHASVHLSSESVIDIRKAVGALLLGLDEEWLTTVPNPHIIQGI